MQVTIKTDDIYLGDGLYAEMIGDQLALKADRYQVSITHVVYLNDENLVPLLAMIRDHFPKIWKGVENPRGLPIQGEVKDP